MLLLIHENREYPGSPPFTIGLFDSMEAILQAFQDEKILTDTNLPDECYRVVEFIPNVPFAEREVCTLDFRGRKA